MVSAARGHSLEKKSMQSVSRFIISYINLFGGTRAEKF